MLSLSPPTPFLGHVYSYQHFSWEDCKRWDCLLRLDYYAFQCLHGWEKQNKRLRDSLSIIH